MTGGWFVGGFNPTSFSTTECEVAVKDYKAGSFEDEHFHKIATEITLFLKGTAVMCGKTWTVGDIVVIPPGTATDFEAISDVQTVVVKLPGALNDKYLTGIE